MAKEFLNGLMAKGMRDSMSMIKKKALECLYGKMERNMKATERMANNMALDFCMNLEKRLEKENGSLAKGLSG
jgi:hypothetical protein